MPRICGNAPYFRVTDKKVVMRAKHTILLAHDCLYTIFAYSLKVLKYNIDQVTNVYLTKKC